MRVVIKNIDDISSSSDARKFIVNLPLSIDDDKKKYSVRIESILIIESDTDGGGNELFNEGYEIYAPDLIEDTISTNNTYSKYLASVPFYNNFYNSSESGGKNIATYYYQGNSQEFIISNLNRIQHFELRNIFEDNIDNKITCTIVLNLKEI